MAETKFSDIQRLDNSYVVHYDKADILFTITMLHDDMIYVNKVNVSDTDSQWQITWNDDKKYHTKYISINAVDQTCEATANRPYGLMAVTIFTNKKRFEELITMVMLNCDYGSYITMRNPKTKKNQEYEFTVTIL